MEQRSKIVNFERNKEQPIKTDVVQIKNKNLSFGEEAYTLDENKTFEKYLDKIDQDRRDQEERISKNIEIMEHRITEERRLSEERMEKRFNETMAAIGTLNSRIDTKVDGINKTIDTKITSLEIKIDGSNKWIMGLCLTTIIGIATMIFAAIAIYPKK